MKIIFENISFGLKKENEIYTTRGFVLVPMPLSTYMFFPETYTFMLLRDIINWSHPSSRYPGTHGFCCCTSVHAAYSQTSSVGYGVLARHEQHMVYYLHQLPNDSFIKKEIVQFYLIKGPRLLLREKRERGPLPPLVSLERPTTSRERHAATQLIRDVKFDYSFPTTFFV